VELFMRRFNTRLFLYLFAGLVLVAGTVFGLHWLQTGRIAQAELWQARHAEEEGHLVEAARHLGRYLEFVPQDTEQLANLGRLLADEHMPNRHQRLYYALEKLEQVAIREPERLDSRRLLIRVAVELGRTQTAREHLTVLLRALPTDGELQLLLGRACEVEEKYREAAAAYARAVELAPHQRDSYLRLAVLLRDHREQAQPAVPDLTPDSVLDKLVAANAQTYQAYLARWNQRQKNWNLRDGVKLAEAGKDVEQAQRLAATEPEVLVAAADLCQARANTQEGPARLESLQKAGKLLEDGCREHPTEARLYQAWSRLELAANKRDEAMQRLEAGLKEMPGRLELLWDLANLRIDAGEVDEARSLIGRLGRGTTTPAVGDYLQARLLIHDGRWFEAARLLERVRGEIDNLAPDLLFQVNLYLAQCYGQLGDPAQQLEVSERLARNNPHSATALERLALALVNQGVLEKALGCYRQMLELPDLSDQQRFAAWAEVARLELLRNRRQGSRDWLKVEEALAEAGKLRPGDADLVVLQAELLRAKDDFRQARQLLLDHKEKEPATLAYWTALAVLADAEKKPDEALQWLTDAEQATGDLLGLRLARASYWVSHATDDAGKARAKEALAKLGDKLDRLRSDDERVLLLRALAEGQARIGEYAESLRLWKQLAALPRYANDLHIRLTQFDVALDAGDAHELDRLLGEIQQLENGQGPLWKHGQALILLERARKGGKADLGKARELLAAVIAQRPNWAPGHQALAELEALAGNRGLAIESYQRAIHAGARDPRARLRLVQLYWQEQRVREADEAVQSLLKDMASLDLQRLAADIFFRNHEIDRAEQELQKVVGKSQDYRDYLTLGQVLAAKGDADRAEQQFRRAVALAGAEPETWVGLVRHLAATGKQKEAEQEMQKAVTLVPRDRQGLMLAQCQEALGKLDEAVKGYEAVLKQSPDDMRVWRGTILALLRGGRYGDAQRWLLKMLDAKTVKAAEADRRWARLALGVMLATRMDYASFNAALDYVGLKIKAGDVVEANDQAGPVTDEELRARAQVLATQQRQRVFRTKAIAYLEELRDRQVLSDGDRYLLAQLYDADGSRLKAGTELSGLALTASPEPGYLVSYAQYLLSQGQGREALAQVERLEELERKQRRPAGLLGTKELRAQALEHEGKKREALDLLRGWAEKADAPPQARLALLAALVRQQRLDEALDLCEPFWKKKSPAEVVEAALVSVGVLRSGPATPAQVGRVEAWLADAVKHNADSAPLLLQFADLRDLQGKFGQAEELYRQALRCEPNNLVAMNNLAWLLGQQKPAAAAEALALIEKAIVIAGPKAELLDTRATVLLALGRTEQAIADLKTANEDTPTPARHFRLACAYRDARDLDAARAALQKAHSAGLKSEMLHPLEKVALQKVTAELEAR
jgi:tetratricopeptide (TPR) repeat protein